MLNFGNPLPVYHFHTSVNITENNNEKLLSEKKRSLLKWANTAGVSSANLNYLWDHIIGDIVETNETSNNAIRSEIKDLKLTVESLKATIDELIVSNKYITMKLMEQEENYLAVLNKNMPDVPNHNNNTYDNDYSIPPQNDFKMSSKKKINTTIRDNFDKNLLRDSDNLEKDIAEKNSQHMPAIKRNKNTRHNSDQSPRQKMLKASSEEEKNVSEASFFDEIMDIPDESQSEIDDELKNTKEMLDKFKDYTLLYDEVKKPKTVKKKNFSRVFGKKEILKNIKPEIKALFPIKNRQQLYEVEKLLVNIKFTKQVREYIFAHKPSSAEQILEKIRLFLDDDLSHIYTYTGTQNKMSFKNTLFNKVIYDAWGVCFESDVYKDVLIQFFETAQNRLCVK